MINATIFIYVAASTILFEVLDQTENEGSTTSFTCQVTGEPVPAISWFFNSVSIDSGSNVNKYNILQRLLNPTTINSTLMIMNVQSSDVGTYTCNATNVISSDNSSGVFVNGKAYTYTF